MTWSAKRLQVIQIIARSSFFPFVSTAHLVEHKSSDFLEQLGVVNGWKSRQQSFGEFLAGFGR